jgi:hypothetical protein
MHKITSQGHTLYLFATQSFSQNGNAHEDDARSACSQHASQSTRVQTIVSGGLKVGHKQLFIADVCSVLVQHDCTQIDELAEQWNSMAYTADGVVMLG